MASVSLTKTAREKGATGRLRATSGKATPTKDAKYVTYGITDAALAGAAEENFAGRPTFVRPNIGSTGSGPSTGTTTVIDNKNKVKATGKASPVNRKGSMSVSPLYFPSGVGLRDEGHFVLFTVKQQNPADLAVRKTAGSGGGASLRSQFQSNLRVSEMIAMYMPPEVQVSDNMKYADQEIGVGGLALGKGVLDYLKGGSVYDSFMGAGGEAAKAKFTDIALGALDFLGGGATAAQIMTGIVRTPHLELMFEGVNRREFNYTFTMTPKNETEAQTIEKIVKVFRREMHPSYVANQNIGQDATSDNANAAFGASVSRFMTFPSVFEIEYKFLGGHAPMPRPRVCSLTKCDVTFGGGEGYVSVGDNGTPQKTTMALSFSEIDIMTRKQVDAGH